MAEAWATLVSFPTVVYTVLLGVVVTYWLLVIFGAVGVHALGGEDAALEGAVKGAVEGVAGAAKGAVEGAAGAAKGAVEGLHGGDAQAIGAARVRSAPVTVVASFVALFGWVLCGVGMRVVRGVSPLAALPSWLGGLLALVVATLVAVPLASLAARPIGRFFVIHHARRHRDLVGKVCVVSTGEVGERFGQATLEDGGAPLILQVRVDAGREVKRGARVLIVGWDDEREGFLVEPMDDVLDGRRENES